MNIIEKTIQNIDTFQRKHHFTAFGYAVIKKYGDDEAGYQAALLTYYGFLSLFPLLLVLTTIAGIVAKSDPALQGHIIDSITNYFPVLGNQLSSHIQGLHTSGFALAAGILFTLYGARGVADALRHGVNHVWQVPHEEREGFPKGPLKSLGIIIIGGIGLIGASLSASFAASAGKGWLFRLIPLVVNLVVIYVLFTILLKVSLPKPVTFHQTRFGAAFASIGLVILQSVGGYVLAHELKNLDALYSNFALALGLLFWLYLQAQVFYYAVEVTRVGSMRLWPRSLSGKDLTAADRKAYSMAAEKQRMVPDQEVKSSFLKHRRD